MKELRSVEFHVPDVITKQLKIQVIDDKRRITLSSNLLLLMGFEGKVSKVVEESLGKGKGYTVRKATNEEIEQGKAKSVYVREYSSRSANPLKKKEHLIQTTRQDLIDESMGLDCTHVHITMTYGLITFTPVENKSFDFYGDSEVNAPINTLVAMTGGVDCHVLEKAGFSISAVVEYRPAEARDNCDYTELTSLSVLANSKPKVLFNEDIYQLNLPRMADILLKANIEFVHASLQCDDYSTLKTHEQRKTSIKNLSSTIDMFMPLLSVLDTTGSPVLLIEQVPGFMTSAINDVVCLQLMRRGFQIYQDIFDARDFGGFTSRQRCYLVATALTDVPFSFPEKTAPAPHVWPTVIEPNWREIELRDVTHTKVAQDSITTNRIRAIKESKHWAPTLTKAQGQDAKDAVVVQKDDKIYRLPVSVQKELNCIDDSFDLEWMPVDKASQIIGQSICGKLHEAIISSVKAHIQLARAQRLQFAV